MLHVEVVYARSDRQYLVTLMLPERSTADEVLRLSGLLERFPEIDVAGCQLGVFGRRVAPQQALRDADRVEIYRPLKADPKEARRERAHRGSRPPR